MGKRAWLFVGMVLLAAGTAQAKASQAEVCADMAQFDANLEMAQNPSPQMTVGQMKAMPDDLKKSYSKFMKSAESYAKPEAKNLDDSIKMLKEHAKKVPDGATMDQAQAALEPDVRQVQTARDQLKATLNCPASPTKMAPPSGQQPAPQPSAPQPY